MGSYETGRGLEQNWAEGHSPSRPGPKTATVNVLGQDAMFL